MSDPKDDEVLAHWVVDLEGAFILVEESLKSVGLEWEIRDHDDNSRSSMDPVPNESFYRAFLDLKEST